MKKTEDPPMSEVRFDAHADGQKASHKISWLRHKLADIYIFSLQYICN